MTSSNQLPDAGADGSSVDADSRDASFRQALARSSAAEIRLTAPSGSQVALSGDRPTGQLHLGHLLGTLSNRVRLQQLGVPLVLVIADYQVLTDRDSTGPLREQVRSLVADYLAAGVDPDRAVIFPHSAVPALNQLILPFLGLVTDAELRRNPTVKDEARAAGRPLSGLLLTYPVHQSADILACGGTVVPIGRDQLPHLELTRTIARRFNQRFGPVFEMPEPLLTGNSTVLGTDGEKMSKSRGNAITLGADEDTCARRLRSFRTDSMREITYSPQNRPEVASLLGIIGALAGRDPIDVAAEIGTGGSAALKAMAVEVVNESLRPLRTRRRGLIADPGHLDGVLLDGMAQANEMASATLSRVRAAMGMDYLRPPG